MPNGTRLDAAPKPARFSHSITEIADLYGVHPKTIRRWIAEGRISAHRIGPRLIRLDPDEVARQLLGAPLGGGAA
ncbi:excisionase family DNA-binding protein [Gordonia sp. DT219]|uniref:excisionase family DNA-binding protein n=1 Tax=Gordonia sp. DT219 TaxID=3416658 RepID=UPI003CF79E82